MELHYLDEMNREPAHCGLLQTSGSLQPLDSGGVPSPRESLFCLPSQAGDPGAEIRPIARMWTLRPREGPGLGWGEESQAGNRGGRAGCHTLSPAPASARKREPPHPLTRA